MSFTIPVDPLKQETINHYKRALNRYLIEYMGQERKERMLNPALEPKDERARYDVWLRDSLLWTLEELEAGRVLYAFRGLLQAQGYSGKVWTLDSTAADCLIFLRNAFEDLIRDHVPGGGR